MIKATEEESASILWKSHYSGTAQDRRLIKYLQRFPALNERTGKPKADKPWKKCRGLKPWYQAGYDKAPDSYGDPKTIQKEELDDPFIEATNKNANFILLKTDCITLREKLEIVRYKDSSIPDSERRASLKGLYSNPVPLDPPIVLINKG